MKGFTPEEHRQSLRGFAWLFFVLLLVTLAVAGFLYLMGDARAARLVAGFICPVPLVCVAIQWVELKQLEKRQ